MIGNDIVDLTLAKQESDWRRPGYLGKLFTPHEQQLIHEAVDQERHLWMLWGAKEAVYKAWSAQTGLRRFAPKRIHTLATASEQTSGALSMITEGITYQVDILQTPNCVYAYTCDQANKVIGQAYFQLGASTLVASQAAVRRWTRQALTSTLQWDTSAISFPKNKLGRPLVYYHGKPSAVQVSWSHHGQWVAVLIAQRVGTD